MWRARAKCLRSQGHAVASSGSSNADFASSLLDRLGGGRESAISAVQQAQAVVKEAGEANCHPVTNRIAKIARVNEKVHHRDLFRFIRLPLDTVWVECPVCDAGSDPAFQAVYEQPLPMYDPHEMLDYLYSTGRIWVSDDEIQRYWHHWTTVADADWARRHPGKGCFPMCIYGDEARYNLTYGDKFIALTLGSPLVQKAGSNGEHFLFFIVSSAIAVGVYGVDTMRPILKRAAWSLKLALQGRRPQANIASSEGFELTRREKLSAGSTMSTKFAVTEFKGDWAWHKFFFEIEPYWKRGDICYRCHAARISRFGHLFTDFAMDWSQLARSTHDFLTNCIPAQQNHLVNIPGFHVDMLRHCSMHVCNLGLFHVLNAEGLTILAEHRASRWGCTFRESLDHLYAEFRQFCTRNKIKCSQRRFKLHSVSAKGLPEYIVLITKAFNARVILGYVADALSKARDELMRQRPMESHNTFVNRKQLWSIGLATVCTFAEWQRLTELFPIMYLTSSQSQQLHDLALQGCHFWLAAAWEASHQGLLRWLVLPKLHLYNHMALDCKRWKCNVRSYHCFSGEDYMGYLKKVVQSTSTGVKMEERALKRSLLKVVATAPAEISNLSARR
ncbi:unnamed protein product [Durusdinium trenchii]|uniref:Uncharacterized protein n=1 Tax=Durusdinium trenchii TaxID=1381693 RepID=A0ABP0JN11_9DINO